MVCLLSFFRNHVQLVVVLALVFVLSCVASEQASKPANGTTGVIPPPSTLNGQNGTVGVNGTVKAHERTARWWHGGFSGQGGAGGLAGSPGRPGSPGRA